MFYQTLTIKLECIC